MVVLSREDARQVAEISAELDTIRIGARSAIEDVLPAARRLLDVEIMSVYSLVESSKGWLFERLVEDGQCGRSSRFWEAVAWAFTRVDTLFYDPRSPAVEMRNRVVESTAWIDRKVPETWLQSQLCRDVFEPSGMEHHKQLRALVCNDDEMLGWFGAITPGPVVPRHYRVLSALVPAMQHRLVAERRLGDACRTRDALERALDHLGAPAFVVGRRGVLHETNAAARALLERDRTEVLNAITDAIAGRPASIRIELERLSGTDCSPAWLAIVRPEMSDARTTHATAAAVARWSLTPRQRDVLAHVVRGDATATIAAHLGISMRAVEHHITAMFARANVENRAMLVAAVLGADGS